MANGAQKSKEKNMTMEDTRRRNEASMARKRAANISAINSAGATPSGTDGTVSPGSTGAMDSLLEKLRAAAPQARDQRDRRRRARLRDRHQIRVASGQEMPDMAELAKSDTQDDEGDKAFLSPQESTTSGEAYSEKVGEMATISESEDIADRAASMLQGLRGDGDGESSRPLSKDGSLRSRRRRESADDERRVRRNRRRTAASNASEDRETTMSPAPDLETTTIPEEALDSSDGKRQHLAAPPQTIISPPSPEGTASRPVQIDDD